MHNTCFSAVSQPKTCLDTLTAHTRQNWNSSHSKTNSDGDKSRRGLNEYDHVLKITCVFMFPQESQNAHACFGDVFGNHEPVQPIKMTLHEQVELHHTTLEIIHNTKDIIHNT